MESTLSIRQGSFVKQVTLVLFILSFSISVSAQTLSEQAKTIAHLYADKLVQSQTSTETPPSTVIDKSLTDKWLSISEGIFIGVQSADTVAYVVMHAQSVVDASTGISQPSIVQQNPVLPNGAVGVVAAKAAVTTAAVIFCEDLWNKGLKVEAVTIFVAAAAATFASDVKPVYNYFRGVTPANVRHNSIGMKFSVPIR